MAISKNKKMILGNHKEEVEAIISASDNGYPLGNRQLKKLLQNVIHLKFHEVNITIDELKSFLIEESQLHKITFQTPRMETVYTWGVIDEYKLLIVLRPNGYYSHLTAMYLHKLVDYEPENIILNNEQRARLVNGSLEQGRIDNAFRNRQRITTARTVYGGKTYWLLNGKQTGNYGVIRMVTPKNVEIPVTNIERTLIDITVRPAYAGGVASVIQAYRRAQPNVSIVELSKTLRSLNYIYPYHQSVGFYVDMAGNYNDDDIKEFLDFQPFEYDFYLDYEIQNPTYSKKWKLYYPNNLL